MLTSKPRIDKEAIDYQQACVWLFGGGLVLSVKTIFWDLGDLPAAKT